MHTKLVDGLAKRGVAELPEGCELVVGLVANNGGQPYLVFGGSK